MTTPDQSRSTLSCLLAVMLVAALPASATAADQPATEEYVLDLPGFEGSSRGEVVGEVVGSGGIVGEGGIDEAEALGDYVGSPAGLLALAPAALVGGIAIRARLRR